ncbi:ZYBA0S09-00914g1_1 [Zygosaccharomyces bailii CLIB 213]|uniref:ZYBA0S09-00914g1_1 n=1 Tax=Zygosaccharomyces bailii (strain CLIB 213 / ATCC 58445 / CBS 680 / BCRC 21525 / NBRC 1098 / NCYC 1416 / NRRL Y-2227) TaxID=1333698 RepID=A0A8J2T8G1_ZYGB2|nr:ZYBA0S09-00914g1_1 [Zygosaccharomyces bailii CLIB 213]
MGILRRLEKLVTNSLVMPNAMPVTETWRFSGWSKDQLIERIVELENASSNNSKKHQNVSNDTPVAKRPKAFDFSKYNTRFIALKFAYLGWNYNGLAIQREVTPLPTVEGILVDILLKCKLIGSRNIQDFKFSRCGRTDKGVSAMSQVVSLKVRSNLTDEEQSDPVNDARELQYVNILNQLLPDDIRVSAVCLRPPKGFDARYSCQHRHYKYLFNKQGLDLGKMEEAAAFFDGEHDFRNFCKLDGSKQITNYNRKILSAKILHVTGDIYCFDLIGTAFLWHQVRCMMATLFLVGQGLEESSLIADLLDMSKTPQKPIYDMADDLPLILYDCKFPEMEWLSANSNEYKAIKYNKIVTALNLHYQLKATVAQIFTNSLTLKPDPNVDFSNKIRINLGDGTGKVVTKYAKMAERQVMESAETVNEKYRKRKKGKSLKL